MRKIVLFVPGFKEGIDSRDYASVLRAIELRGYDVRFVDISWKRTTIEDWARQLEKEYEKYDAKNTILSGFSFGALTAFITSANRPPSELWLFSLSPFFAEDLPNLKKWELKLLGTNRVTVAKRTSFNELAKRVTCPVKLFSGSKELAQWPEMSQRYKDVSNKLASVTSIIADGVGHSIEKPAYIDTISESI